MTFNIIGLISNSENCHFNCYYFFLRQYNDIKFTEFNCIIKDNVITKAKISIAMFKNNSIFEEVDSGEGENVAEDDQILDSSTVTSVT